MAVSESACVALHSLVIRHVHCSTRVLHHAYVRATKLDNCNIIANCPGTNHFLHSDFVFNRFRGFVLSAEVHRTIRLIFLDDTYPDSYLRRINSSRMSKFRSQANFQSKRLDFGSNEPDNDPRLVEPINLA